MKVAIAGKGSFIGKVFLEKYLNVYDIDEISTLNYNEALVNFKDCDVVIHLAAIVHQTKSISDDVYFKVNRDLAYNVALKAKEHGVKQFIFMSTAKVFGESTTGKDAWNESSVCNPQDAYGKSKLEAERLLLSLNDAHFKVAVIRSPLVYGAGVKANMFNLIKLIDTLPVLPLKNISNRRSFVYVGNLVALFNHLICNKAEGIFIAGDSDVLSVSEVAYLISRNLNKHTYYIAVPGVFLKLLKKMKPSVFERVYGSLELDNAMTNTKLKFIPPYTTSEGIKDMVEWYKLTKK